MHKVMSLSAALVAFALPFFATSAAEAQGLASCGNIHVEANAQCKAVATGGCDVRCTELKFEAACHAEGFVSCEGQCSGSATAQCTGQCDVSACEAKCT